MPAFYFLYLCKPSQYRIPAFSRFLHQQVCCLQPDGGHQAPPVSRAGFVMVKLREDEQQLLGAACSTHFYGCKTRHDNRSPYFFSCSPTVHCRMQNWWAYFFPRVFRKCDFKKQPSQYVFNISSTSRMSCFLSIFIPSFRQLSHPHCTCIYPLRHAGLSRGPLYQNFPEFGHAITRGDQDG